ncbi:unnamed protein product [Linum tenue]|uniref:Uncharacterized protein n=1 Tax=Linum tenue TaxID=586396 RepID=A0AAV0JUR2_9ROSI|nr:unnamed protein product [Linum tenue]
MRRWCWDSCRSRF